jgi:hypothetical protein
MKLYYKKYDLFSGLILCGTELLPCDIKLSLEDIRDWAKEQNLIQNADEQLIDKKRIKDLSKHFKSKDNLSILIHICKNGSGKLHYFEYPSIPIKSLVKTGQIVDLIYWEILPCAWDMNGNVREYNEVRLGFLYSSIAEEFCTISNSRLILKRFLDFYYNQPDEVCEKRKLNNGKLSIEVNGRIKAQFFKIGRFFDVELIRHIEVKEWQTSALL